MPNWKKVIVSGSNVSQLNNDGVYLKTVGGGILSSSAQIASEISGAFTGAGFVDVGLAASSSRIAIWEDSNTIGGSPNFAIANGFITAGGGTIRRYGSTVWSTGTVSFSISSPVSCRGAFITYVIFSNDAGKTSFRAGNVTAAWNAAGSSVVFNETTTTTIGTIPTITTDVTLIGGEMYLTFTQTSGTLFNVQANVDTLGL